MKMNIIKILYFSIFLYGTFVLTSCETGDELHMEWLNKGEHIYAGKVDSVAVHGGFKRVNLETDVTVKNLEKVMIYWNSYTDSVSIPVNQEKGMFNVTIENMEEQSYVFNVVTVDIYGNRSLPFEAVGEVFGDYYVSTLANRRYKALVSISGKVRLDFNPALDGTLFTEVSYTNTNDETVNVKVLPTEESLLMDDYKSNMTYRSGFKPNELALDTFYTEYFTKFPERLQIDKAAWSIVDFSSEHSSGGDHRVLNTIDGDPATSWHTLVTWSGGKDYPHHVVIDLGAPTMVTEMDLFNDIDAGDKWGPAKFEIFVSEDNVDFTLVGEFDSDSESVEAQNYKLDIANKIQFFKFVATQPGPAMVDGVYNAHILMLGEISLFQ